MTIRTVGPEATYPTIAAAVTAAAAGDTLRLAAGYSGERAVLTVQDLTVAGGATALDIALVLGAGIGQVSLAGQADISVLDNAGANHITGNAGDNLVRVSGGADVVLGGDGRDRLVVNYAQAVDDVIATVGSVTDGGTRSVTFEAVEDVVLLTGSGDDSLTAGDGDNLLRSRAGNDTITTGQGSSRIASGAGNDTVTTGDGGNLVDAGGGDNTVTTGAGADVVASGRGNDTLETGDGDDRVQVSGGIDTADAGLGHDLLRVDYGDLSTGVTGGLSAGSAGEGYTGLVDDGAGNSVSFSGAERFHVITGAGGDDVRTGGGEDTLAGGLGDDFLQGGGGADVLAGGGDADTLSGGRGADILAGGQGADVFRFDDFDSVVGAADRVTDLRSQDTIDLSRIDADVTVAGDQAFVFVASFSGTAGEATTRYQAATDLSRMAFDTDGDGAADIVIVAAGDQRAFDHYVL